MGVTLHEGDLPEGLDLGPAVAIDTETMGLAIGRDRLCVVQLSRGDGSAEVVRIAAGQRGYFNSSKTSCAKASNTIASSSTPSAEGKNHLNNPASLNRPIPRNAP